MEILRRTPWSKGRSGNKTACTKNSWRLLANGKPTGNVWKEDNCSFRHDMNKAWEKFTIKSVSEFFHAAEWAKCVENPIVPEEKKSTVVECLDGLCKDYLKGTCNNFILWESGTLQKCLFYKTKSGLSVWGKSAHSHIVRLMNSRRKGPKRIDDKSFSSYAEEGWLAWKVHGNLLSSTMVTIDQGRPDKKRDHELERGPTGRRTSNARQLGCVFQDMTPAEVSSPEVHRHAESNPTCEIHKGYCASPL